MAAGEIAQQVAADLFASAFNDAAAKVRGYNDFRSCPDKVTTEIVRMAAHFGNRYRSHFATGGSPVGLAKRLTDIWWDMDPDVRDRAGR